MEHLRKEAESRLRALTAEITEARTLFQYQQEALAKVDKSLQALVAEKDVLIDYIDGCRREWAPEPQPEIPY